jgi:RNA polymerase sigma factor (TIGR02999 family)
MAEVPDNDITNILRRWSGGDRAALDELTPLVYRELLRIAHARLRLERQDHSLESTELVHEVYLRMVDQSSAQWRDRVHFFAASSQIIRHILVDHARARLRERRGGGLTMLALDESLDASPARAMDLIALDDALQDLARLDARQSHVVELRFFGGLEIDEVAEVLGVSRATVNRDWVTARAWLMRQLSMQ